MSDQQKLPGIMDRLWSALNYGSLTEIHKKKTLAATARPPPPDADYWTVIKKKINGGVLFVEIGGCLTASSVAADWNLNSIVISLLFKDLYNECISNARESGLRNFLIGSITQVQQMVESLFFDQAVAIEHLFLSNLQVLCQSLLPHECESLLSKLLALSWRVYIVNPTVNIGHVSLYTHWWANLGTFLHICCQKRNCIIDLLNGTNSWESPAIFQVTQKSGYRPIIDINKKPQQSFQVKPDKNFLKDTGNISQLNNRYSFAVLTKGVSFSKESIQFLFLTCLQMPADFWNEIMHLPFITLKPFHLHIYLSDPLQLKILIKTGTQKYTTSFKTYKTFKPDQTLNYDAVGEFWDREVVINDPHKSANEREVAISNAFWDRDGSFLEREVKKDTLPFWSDDIWNREESEESHRHNSGMFKSRNKFHNQAGNSQLHNSEGSFHLSRWRSFQDNNNNNNVPDLVNGISATKQKYFTIQREVFSKTSFFQYAQRPPLFLSKRKITLKQGKKLTVPTKEKKIKENLFLSRKLDKIDENFGLNQNNWKQEIPFIKNKIVLNKINPKNSKRIEQKIIHDNDLRNSTWNQDRFKWNLPRYHSVQLNFTSPIPKMVEYISMKKTRLTGNKVKEEIRKAKFSSKMAWNQRKSKLGESRIKKEFSPDQSREDPNMDNGIKISNNFPNILKMEQIKISQENNRPQEKKDNERIYQSQWDAVKFLFKQNINGNFSLLVYGSKHLTLLAAKTGLLYPHSTVLNIVPMLDATFADIYRDILPPNVLTAINDLDPQIITTISHLPNLFCFQILGVEIFAKIFFLQEGFIEYLGNILRLAQVTIFTLPKLKQFILARIIFGNMNGTEEQNQDFSFKKLILKAAAMIGEELNIKVIKDDDDLGGSLLFVELKHLKKEVIVDCSHGKGLLIFESSVSTYIQTDNSVISFDTRSIVISLLLALKLRAADKKQLFLSYLHLPLYKDMCPHLIFWSADGLSHSDQEKESKYKQFSTDSDTNLLARIFTKELMESSAPFSFLEYQSDGSLISQLAKTFPNSTFIAATQDHQTATFIYQEEAITNRLENLLITQHNIDDIFTLKLLKSPEFFRYQFMGYKCFLNLASALSRRKFNLMIGQLLSISASNFLILPSEKTLSLGLLTFYPEFHSDQWSEMDHNSEKNIYLSTNHPSTFYKNSERKIIFESARADVHAELEAITSQHFHLRDGNLFPWRLLRVNINNLTTQVEHHFESYLDGHTRTYIQRCTSLGNAHYEVHLQRQSDGLMIPYGNINAITLISLLRMGLLAEIQKKLYYQFLKLPLYEDMAPWNIVFSAGQLEYIDFDTKNKTFDFLAPMAYQIMSMLMNYERTIRDFGKCKSPAKTQFGFGFISNCVGSDFLGPCKDSLQPVPCGDYTCRSTFIDCLQALAIKVEETKKKQKKKTGKI